MNRFRQLITGSNFCALKLLKWECSRQITTEVRPPGKLIMTALKIWDHRVALTGLLPAGDPAGFEDVPLPTVPMNAILKYLDRLATDVDWPAQTEQLTIHRNLKTHEAGHRVGEIDRTAADARQIINDRSIAWQVACAESEEDLEDIEWSLGITRKQIREAADRSARLETASVVETFRSREQATLRRSELDQFAFMMVPASKNWDRRVSSYLRASRERCRLLGLYFDPRRGPPASANLPMSPDVEAEFIETNILLVGWRKELLEIAGRTEW